MYGKAATELIGESDVKVVGAAGEDIDPEIIVALHREKSNRGRAKAKADSLRE